MSSQQLILIIEYLCDKIQFSRRHSRILEFRIILIKQGYFIRIFMSAATFLKRNIVLIAGLLLPIMLMAFFMISAMIPAVVADPPQYNMVFSTQDNYQYSVPLSVNFVVQDGVLKAQYTKGTGTGTTINGWKKLYLFDAKTQNVKELALPMPANAQTMTNLQEDAVAATKGMQLDTNLESPDGYSLSYVNYTRSNGLFGDLLWGGSGNNQACLKKGNNCVKLLTNDNRTYFYPGYVQFIGWVKP